MRDCGRGFDSHRLHRRPESRSVERLSAWGRPCPGGSAAWRRRTLRACPPISAFCGIAIFVYWNEGHHARAHFHARYAGQAAADAYHELFACWARIELLAPDTEGRPFSCTLQAVGGPFLVPVHLQQRYRGQTLVDPVTGRGHALTPRAELHSSGQPVRASLAGCRSRARVALDVDERRARAASSRPWVP